MTWHGQMRPKQPDRRSGLAHRESNFFDRRPGCLAIGGGFCVCLSIQEPKDRKGPPLPGSLRSSILTPAYRSL